MKAESQQGAETQRCQKLKEGRSRTQDIEMIEIQQSQEPTIWKATVMKPELYERQEPRNISQLLESITVPTSL